MSEKLSAQGSDSVIGKLQKIGRDISNIMRPPDIAEKTPNQLRYQLFFTSFVILFFELMCIRWIPAYVRYMGYFTNFILLAAFLGIGVGILTARQQRFRFMQFPVWLFILVAVVGMSRFELSIPSTQVLYYGAGEVAAQAENWVALPLIFAIVTLAFIQLARPLGQLLTALPPLQAYAIDIIGSLAGIAVFFVMSYLFVNPLVWFVVLLLGFLPMLSLRQHGVMLPFSLAALYFVFILSQNGVWSPYYHIVVTPSSEKDSYVINVNNIGHQGVAPYLQKETFYFRAYDLLGKRPFKNVLIMGAGSGSDVAIALNNGAEHVDAVEIDPLIYQLGQTLNPDHPYADPRVTVYVDDGRAFLRNNNSRYDLVIFALPDSLTLTSGFASLRLESFLLTTDAIKSAREHLTDDGLVVMYNYYREDWLVHKLAGMLTESFGTPPFVTTYGAWGRAAVFMDGPRLKDLPAEFDVPYTEKDGLVLNGRGVQLPVIGMGRLSGDPNQTLATDDWPFVYMPVPTLPIVYLGALSIVLVAALALLVVVVPRATLLRFDWLFFFLGSAFMLLETRSLVTFALLFGTTWVVNSLVFFAILFSVLLSILFNARFKLKRIGPLYIVLFAVLLFNYFLPSHVLLGISTPIVRYTLASLLTFTPIFLANIVFSHSFRDSQSADVAFASNLLGAMVGGCLEYLALAFGYQNLLVPVIGFYLIAFVLQRRRHA